MINFNSNSNSNSNNKNNLNCLVCKGSGLIKNFNYYCASCNAHRCKYTMNIFSTNLDKYKYCAQCIRANLSGAYKPKSPEISKAPDSTNIYESHCIKCLGEGYYFNPGVKCESCEIPHRVCNCVDSPFNECYECGGTGLK